MKTQRLLLPALLMFGGFLASCSKEASEPNAEKLAAKNALASANVEVNTLVVDTNAVKTALRAAPWTYYELFGAYHTTASKLLYKHERLDNNALNVRNDITTYNPTKNTFVETIPAGFGTTLTIEGYFFFTYKSLATKTEVTMTSVITSPAEYRGTSVAELTRLPDNINYVWYSEATDRLGIMYHPTTIPVSSTGTVKSRLITKKWQYENYFSDYSQVDCNLLFRMNRRGDVLSVIDLSPIQVVFNEDGSYTETRLNPFEGDTVTNGRWWLTDNDTRVHTQLDGLSFESVAEVRLLNANRFQWATLPGGGTSSRAATNPITYADMVVQGTTIP